MEDDKGFRPGKKEEIKAKIEETMTYSPEEIERIKEVRKYDKIKPGTYTEKIAVFLDSLRSQFREIDNLIAKRLWNIEDIAANVERNKEEISSGNITLRLADREAFMTVPELKNYVQNQKWIQVGEVRSIPAQLASLRAIVGHKDVKGNEIISEKEFDEYVDKVQARLEVLGYKLFD